MPRAFRALLLSLALASSPAIAADAPYPPVTQAASDIQAALKEAAAGKKRVLLDFGGNWCPDCRVLDLNFRKPETTALLKESFVLVHVNVGDKGITDNFQIAERYGVPLKKGVPAIAVLDSDGRVIYSQKNGEFASMRNEDPRSVDDFLRKWRRPG
jgi:thiol-disulfide isomerase/thioredoxin